jgi:hypothetical protein
MTVSTDLMIQDLYSSSQMAFRYLHYNNDPSRFTVSNLRNN